MAEYNGTSSNDYYNYMGSEMLTAYGYGGNDTIWGNTKSDNIFGHDGDDKLYGWTGDDYLWGGWGNDQLNGGDGNDNLFGQGGRDTLIGGSGNDYISGSDSTTYNSREYDILNGGAGFDTFVLGTLQQGNYYQGSGHAVIEDYNSLYDYIQVKGSASSFSLDKSLDRLGGTGIDTAIYSGGDLLAIVQDTTDIYLTDYYFNFV